MQKKYATTRPRSDTRPTSVWLQLFDEDDNLLSQRKYNNISMLAARQKAYRACATKQAHKALVLRGACNPENPAPSDIWEDYTREADLKGFAPVPVLQISLGKPV